MTPLVYIVYKDLTDEYIKLDYLQSFTQLIREEGYNAHLAAVDSFPPVSTERFGIITFGTVMVGLPQEVLEMVVCCVSYDTDDFPKNNFDNGIYHYSGSMQNAYYQAINKGLEVYFYPSTERGFYFHTSSAYQKPSASISYSRTLKLLRGSLGPNFDLEKIWEKHTLYEFGERDVHKTMATMVANPYVNHVPTLMGGIGKQDLTRFYKYHFINSNPEDFELIPVSRTVGIDRLVDEMIALFTHTCEIDWLLPGVPPTGKKVKIPLVAVVNIRGGLLYHEHIYWDQASVLVQVGLLKKEGLPVSGVEQAEKLLDEKGVASNQLLKQKWAESERKPL